MGHDRTLRYGEVDPMIVRAIRGAGHTAGMFDDVPRDASRVPPAITDAEEWRVLGDKLRTLSPTLYQEMVTALAAISLPSDESEEKITSSYRIC